jgi:hypothetical protein
MLPHREKVDPEPEMAQPMNFAMIVLPIATRIAQSRD